MTARTQGAQRAKANGAWSEPGEVTAVYPQLTRASGAVIEDEDYECVFANGLLKDWETPLVAQLEPDTTYEMRIAFRPVKK